jgi:hypothetical protein
MNNNGQLLLLLTGYALASRSRDASHGQCLGWRMVERALQFQQREEGEGRVAEGDENKTKA